VITLSYDLAEENNCELAVEETLHKFSSLDVLVNCAGILVLGTVDSLSTADYDRVMNLNTRQGQQKLLFNSSSEIHLS